MIRSNVDNITLNFEMTFEKRTKIFLKNDT